MLWQITFVPVSPVVAACVRGESRSGRVGGWEGGRMRGGGEIVRR